MEFTLTGNKLPVKVDAPGEWQRCASEVCRASTTRTSPQVRRGVLDQMIVKKGLKYEENTINM